VHNARPVQRQQARVSWVTLDRSRSILQNRRVPRWREDRLDALCGQIAAGRVSQSIRADRTCPRPRQIGLPSNVNMLQQVHSIDVFHGEKPLPLVGEEFVERARFGWLTSARKRNSFLKR